MELKVLLINGSPHEQGSTAACLSEIASVLQGEGIETEFFHLGTDPVYGCIACRACTKLGKCVYDDAANRLSALAVTADGFVFGSPVYYAGANGAFCAVLDRAFYSASGNFAHKPAASIVVCRRGGAASAFDRLNKYLTINQMPVASSQYWNAAHGHNAEEVRQDAEGMQIMRTLARNLAWLMRSLKDTEKPVQEPRTPTNFIRQI